MTFNPLHDGGNIRVLMVAVLRHSDKTVVALFTQSRELTKEGVRECITGNINMQPAKRYTSQGDQVCIHYILDAQGRVYILVTNPKYPPRLAFTALDELQKSFSQELGPKVASATEESLSRQARNILKDIHDRYEEPEDKLSSVQGKIDVAKSTMKDNIQQMLMNEEKLNAIEEASDHLKGQAANFHAGAKDLKNKQWWNMWRMRLLIGGLVVAVLLIIIVPIAVSNQK